MIHARRRTPAASRVAFGPICPVTLTISWAPLVGVTRLFLHRFVLEFARSSAGGGLGNFEHSGLRATLDVGNNVGALARVFFSILKVKKKKVKNEGVI